ncbi:MAG: hypothetical protein IJW77_03815 [Clostridia bacterium]|nr:hypothetical protein [Clostridia bacterium]
MKQKQRIFGWTALCLAVLMASSCASTDITQTPSTDVSEHQTETTTTETESLYPALLEMDCEGRTVNVLIRTEWGYEFLAEEETGDTVNDAVLMRNLNVEEAYNVTFSFLDFPGAHGVHMDYVNRIHNSVLAADGAFDIITGYQAYMPLNISYEDMMNLNELPYLQTDAPWWGRAVVESLSFNDRCYVLGGDIAVSLLEGIYCMYFNKTLAENFDTEDLYELVRTGKWTHEAMIRVIRGTAQDLDGDNQWTNGDLYGSVTSPGYLQPYLLSYETPTLAVADDGFELVWNTERTASVIEKLVDMTYSEDVFFAADWASVDTLFRNSQVLLAPSMLGKGSIFRDMEDDFGILPYPKLDESQKSYATTTLNEVTMVGIPITAPDPELSALMTEALCRESHDTVAPAFYDIALKGKYTRDENSVEMIELIRDSLTFDIGWMHTVICGLSAYQYYALVNEKTTDFSSWYASKKSAFEKGVSDLNALYFE